MTQQAQQAEPAGQPSAPPHLPRHREWFWRVLAALMLAMLGWMGWVAYQLTPYSVATPAAYAAITQARAARNVQEGTIRHTPPPQAPKKAPVDVEKLRLSDSIETPLSQK